MVEPSSFTVMPALEPELVILIVATPPTLLAVTVDPTKLSTVAEVTTLLPSSCTVIPEINGLLLESTLVIVIVATPLALLATTPAPTKLIVLAEDITVLPSSLMVIPVFDEPKAAVYWNVPSANLIPT